MCTCDAVLVIRPQTHSQVLFGRLKLLLWFLKCGITANVLKYRSESAAVVLLQLLHWAVKLSRLLCPYWVELAPGHSRTPGRILSDSKSYPSATSASLFTQSLQQLPSNVNRRRDCEGLDDKIGEKGRQRTFFSSSCRPPATSVSSLTPPLLTSHSLHHPLFITLHLSVQPGRLHVHVHTFSTSTAAKKESALTSACTHTAALFLSPSLAPSGTLRPFLHFKKSWLQGRHHVFLYITCCLTLSISIHPSPPGRLDYISALVRAGDVVTPVISFIDCPSICPPTHSSVHTAIRFHDSLSVQLFKQTQMCYNSSLSSHFTLRSVYFYTFYFYYFTSLFTVILCHLPDSFFHTYCAMCLSGTYRFTDKCLDRGMSTLSCFLNRLNLCNVLVICVHMWSHLSETEILLRLQQRQHWFMHRTTRK